MNILKDPVKKKVFLGVLSVVLLMFCFEYGIMFVFSKVDMKLDEFVTGFLDPLILVTCLSPFFYYLILRPLFDNAEELKKAKEAERRFLSSMSHEIRTPLNAIMGLLGFLTETDLNKEQRYYVQSINSASENLLAQINDILDFTKIEQGHLDLDTNFFDLQQLENEIRDVFQPIVGAKKIEFIVQNNLASSVRVLADIFRIKQVIYNLISNSLKFTQSGSISLQISSRNRDEQSMDLVITITDTGIGMSKEVTEKLFHDFFQGESAVARKYGGTGLGLSISQRLIHLMKGKIQVASQQGVGTKFTVILPVVYSEQFTEEDIQKIEKKLSFRSPEMMEKRKSYRILVAEDNSVNLEITMKMLEKSGYSTSMSVVNGLHVLDEVQKRSYDLILMDCQMPELDGFETTRRLRSQGYTKPVLALTANALQSDKESCIKAGMTEYISKPITLEKLIMALDRNLGIG